MPSRRQFLQLMAGSLALAGLGGTAGGCTRQPTEHILPYVKQPERLILGVPQRYATAMPHFGGFVRGVLVESHEGRPTKIEGNPRPPRQPRRCDGRLHPGRHPRPLRPRPRAERPPRRGNLLLGQPLRRTRPRARRANGEGRGGAAHPDGERHLADGWRAARCKLLRKYPQAKWHQHEPLDRGHADEGARLAFGEVVATHHDFAKAKVVLSLDSDFLFAHPDSLRYARGFAAARRVRLPPTGGEDPAQVGMTRLYVVEPTPTITGSDGGPPAAARRRGGSPVRPLPPATGVRSHGEFQRLPPGKEALAGSRL